MAKFDIHKAAGIIIQDKKLLVVKPTDKKFFISPGGSIEIGESAVQAVIRELKEELQIDVTDQNLQPFGIFYAQAAGEENKVIRMDTFIVTSYQGEIKIDNEIEQLAWISSTIPANMKVGSIFEHEVIPRLKAQGLIK